MKSTTHQKFPIDTALKQNCVLEVTISGLCSPSYYLQEKTFSVKQNTWKRKMEPSKHWSIQWSLCCISNRQRPRQTCFSGTHWLKKILNSWLEMLCSEPKLNSLYKFFFIVSHSVMYCIHLPHSSSEPTVL